MLVPIQFGAFLWVQQADWPGLRDAAARAEAAGFDSLWISDHLIAPFPSRDVAVVEAWTTLAALAATTRHMRLGLLVGNNLLRHPAVVAKMAVTVDRISNGRLTIGLGSGWLEVEARMHGLEFGASAAARVDRLEEAVTVIRGLGSGEPVNLTGTYYTLSDAVHRPVPIQARIPLLIGGNGRERTLAVVARHADAWHATGDLSTLADLDAALVAHCESNGRDPAGIERVTHRWIRIRDDIGKAESVLAADLVRHRVSAPEPWLPLVGPPAVVGAGLRPLIELGFRHLLVALASPFDVETIDRVAELREEVRGYAANSPRRQMTSREGPTCRPVNVATRTTTRGVK